MAVTYKDIIISPYKFEYISEMKIIREPNEHNKLSLSGVVPEEELDKYIETMDGKTLVTVSVNEDEKTKIIFKGIVTKAEIKAEMDVREMKLEALSTTYMMDIQKRTRSFQNSEETYTKLIKTITDKYNPSDVKDMVTQGKTTGNILVQYKETDWEFIKRLASHFNAPLTADCLFKGPRYHIGMPNKNEKFKKESVWYTVKKDIGQYKIKSENSVKGLDENNFIVFEIESRELLELGNNVSFKGRNYIIGKVESTIINGMLTHKYTLCDKNGLKVRKIQNEKLSGLTLFGEVIDIEKDKVKVKLDIDGEQDPGKAQWIQYATVYSSKDGSGWFCMPEIGDRVRVYIPDGGEKNIFASSSISPDSENNERRQDPNVKSLSTKYGKEIKLTPGGIEIIANGKTLLRLTDDGGIEINSDKKIILEAKEDILISSGEKLIISGDKEVNLEQGQTKLNIKENISLEGKQVNIK